MLARATSYRYARMPAARRPGPLRLASRRRWGTSRWRRHPGQRLNNQRVRQRRGRRLCRSWLPSHPAHGGRRGNHPRTGSNKRLRKGARCGTSPPSSLSAPKYRPATPRPVEYTTIAAKAARLLWASTVFVPAGCPTPKASTCTRTTDNVTALFLLTSAGFFIHP